MWMDGRTDMTKLTDTFSQFYERASNGAKINSKQMAGFSLSPRLFWISHDTLVFTVRNFYHIAQPPSLRTTLCRLSASVYSIYSQLHSIPSQPTDVPRCGDTDPLIMGRGEVHTEFWWGNLRERDQSGEPGVAGRIILVWILISCVYVILFCLEMCLKMKI